LSSIISVFLEITKLSIIVHVFVFDFVVEM